MREDHHTGRSHHHVGPAQLIHRNDSWRFPILSADSYTNHLFCNSEEVSVAVLRVTGTRSSHRVCHCFQVRLLFSLVNNYNTINQISSHEMYTNINIELATI